jgi:hypothetical protein
MSNSLRESSNELRDLDLANIGPRAICRKIIIIISIK